MKPINTRTWSTPLIIGCSMVVAASGVMLFFHVGEDLIKSMHEWLGLLFVAAILLHVLNHWVSFKRYFKAKQAVSVLALVAMLATGWVVGSGQMGGGGQHPAKRLVNSVQQAPIALVAQLQQQKGSTVMARLQAAGLQVQSDQQSINELASLNKRNPFELMDIMLGSAEKN